MAVELQSENGTKFPLPPRYWSFFLTLAQTCEWQPKGSSKPKGFGLFKTWNGNYESSDGQKVTSQDALELGKGLNRCYYSMHCMEIMQSVAQNVEAEVQKQTGLIIPEEMRIKVSEELKESLGKLMAFTYQGAFSIL